MTLLQDLRYAVRMLWRTRGLTLAAIVSLGLGIGANTTIFAWMKATVLQPLPGVADPGSIVVVASRNSAGAYQAISYLDFKDLRARTKTLEDIVAQDLIATNVRLEGHERAERVYGAIVSGNYFHVLGVKAALGRVFTEADDVTPDADPVVVISDRIWRVRFNADPSIIGRTLLMNGKPFTLIGVTPPDFNGTFLGLGIGLFVPMMMQKSVEPGANRLTERGNRWLVALGRLQPGATVAEANTELVTIARQLELAYPQSNEKRGAAALAMWESPWGAPFYLKPVLSVIGILVMLVLVIACANVANLLLARAVSRQREIAIRLSLGAARPRLLRQLLTESVLLALVAGVAGLIVARWSSHLLDAFVPPMDIPIILGLKLDRASLIYALVISVVTGIAFGLAPAWQASNPDVVESLKDTAGQAGGGRRTWLRNALVVAQVSFSVVLLVAAMLFLRALSRAYAMDPGFASRNLVLAGFDLFPNGYTPTTGAAFHRSLLDRVTVIRGVQSAAIARSFPLGPSNNSSHITVAGYTPAPTEATDVGYNTVSPGYFRTMGIPLLRGREFTWQDDEAARGVAIVNETFARRYWRTLDVVGRTFEDGRRYEVIGVAKDGKYNYLNETPQPFMYFTEAQWYRADATLIVQVSGTTADVTAAVRAAVRGLDPNLPLYDVRTLDELLIFATFPQRIASIMLALFGALALLLAVVGLYAVISYAVGQRTREIGIRVALGATPGTVASSIVQQGGRLALLGVAIGLMLSYGGMRFATMLLNGISPGDPLTFTAVALGLTAVSLIAAALPARRASKIDPVIALRQD